MGVRFVLLTNSTAFDVFSDVRGEAGPPKFGGDQLSGLKVPGMSGCFVVVAPSEDGMTDRIIVGNVYSAFVSEDSSLMLPVRETGSEGEGDRTVHRLEGLEYKRVVS